LSTLTQTKIAPAAGIRTDEPLPVVVRTALWAVAGAILACWIALVVIHRADDYRVTHMQGVWIALAEAARGGDLYAPLFDGERYAGTRYMPLPILLNALASSLIGDPWIAGKLVAASLMGGLLALVLVVLRQLNCPWPIAVALAAVVVATETGLQAGTTIGGDLLPVVLQVGALAVVSTRRGRWALLAAGGLAGLAFASKLTGVWAALAITTWLVLRREWRAAAAFAVACVVAAGVVLGAVEVLTRGGLSEHLLAFSVAGVQSVLSLLRGPNQVLYNLLEYASGAVVLFPLAVLGTMLPGRSWRPPLVHLALGYAVLVLLVVYADVGTGFNQLIDLVVLVVLAAGHLAGRAAAGGDPRQLPVLVLTVAIAAAWAAGLDLVRTVGFDLRRAAAAIKAHEATPRAATLVAGLIRPDEDVLAEDPSIPVALGRRPVVMDPFMLARLDRAHAEWIDPLIARIEQRQFDLVVMVVPLENRNVDFWWTDFHFGPRVADALRRSYRFDRRVERYTLYRPEPDAHEDRRSTP
jgi:hypothetical protein